MQFIEVRREGHVTIVTINRPKVMNALHIEADRELDQAWQDFEADKSQRVAILTGAGDRAFSAGNDLKEHAKLGSRQFLPTGLGGITARFGMEKPVIAAVNGLAFGGGFEIALSCDLIIADENAAFALPEPRVGLAAVAGGIQHLVTAIGLPRAMGILLTGRRVAAREGYELGFVTAVAASGGVLDEALRWAAQIAECSPMALAATKQVARHVALSQALRESLVEPHQSVVRLRKSRDYLEGPRAFAEKRKPIWSQD